MIGPTDRLHPPPAPHFKTFQVFLIYCLPAEDVFPMKGSVEKAKKVLRTILLENVSQYLRIFGVTYRTALSFRFLIVRMFLYTKNFFQSTNDASYRWLCTSKEVFGV
jgi:hypothetical protein